MAVTIKPQITKILLDLQIDPIDLYDVDNAEQTYKSAVREGINTIESATKGKGDGRSVILREEVIRVIITHFDKCEIVIPQRQYTPGSNVSHPTFPLDLLNIYKFLRSDTNKENGKKFLD